jgi:protein tyrosine phosphatase (PTP) superfamily phosphohydrolase (DUF442 family)
MQRRIAITSALLVCTTFTAASTAAPAPQRLAMPAPTFRLEGDGLVVPMESWQGRSVVQVMLDGRGPFPFVLDTGAGATVITRALADSLQLKVTGEAEVGSPLGGRPAPAKIVSVERLTLGRTLQAPVTCLALDLPMPGPAKHWGVLSPNQFPGLLITWDFARQRIVFRRGSLPAADGVQIFSYQGEMLPTMPVEVVGRRVLVHVDTGSSGGLTLPATLQDSLPLAGPPVEGHTARTVDREIKLLEARLAGEVVVGGRTFTDPTIQLNPAARVGNLGARMLRDFEVTMDARQKSIQLRPLAEGERAVPGRTSRSPAAAEPGGAVAAGDLAAIATGLTNGMAPLPGVATSGLPREEDFAALAHAGCRTVIDLCMPGEPRGYDEARVVRAAGLDYVPIPFTRATLSAAQIEEFRRLMRDPARRPVLVHCIAANRVGGIMLPYLMLDEGMSEQEALALARKIGLHSPELETVGLEYANSQRGRSK